MVIARTDHCLRRGLVGTRAHSVAVPLPLGSGSVHWSVTECELRLPVLIMMCNVAASFVAIVASAESRAPHALFNNQHGKHLDAY